MIGAKKYKLHQNQVGIWQIRPKLSWKLKNCTKIKLKVDPATYWKVKFEGWKLKFDLDTCSLCIMHSASLTEASRSACATPIAASLLIHNKQSMIINQLKRVILIIARCLSWSQSFYAKILQESDKGQIFSDQFRPALGPGCCRLSIDCYHAQKTSKLAYFRLF